MTRQCRILVVSLSLLLIFQASLLASWETTARSFKPSQVKDVEVNIVTGGITIQMSEGDSLVVQLANGLKTKSDSDIAIDLKDGVLHITETCNVNNPEGKTAWTLSIPPHMTLCNLKCQSSLGDIEIRDVNIDTVSAHAATGRLAVMDSEFTDATLSTTDGELEFLNATALDALKLVSSSGNVRIGIWDLPLNLLDAASTSGQVKLIMPTLGKDFSLRMVKNEGKGQFYTPYACDEMFTRKIHPADTYDSEICDVSRGSGAPQINLTTGTGKLIIEEKLREGH